MTRTGDAILIQSALAGQTECFAILIERHKEAVTKRIRSMIRNKTDEDDLVQEVFLKAWRHLAGFRAEASFRTWITRVATNEVLQRYRRERRSPLCPSPTDLDAFASPDELPDQWLARVETGQTVRNAIAELPAKYRQIIVLRDLKQLSVRETAQSMQIGVPLVKTRLFRARAKLSVALQKNGQQKSRCGRPKQISVCSSCVADGRQAA